MNLKDSFIIEQFQQAVKAAVAASTMPTLDIAFIDVIYEKPDNGKYLEIVHFPNNDDTRFWGDENQYRGAFRLILHWPNNSEGPYPPVQLLESVMSYFTKDRWINGISIVSTPNFSGSIATGSENLYPSTVRYEYLA